MAEPDSLKKSKICHYSYHWSGLTSKKKTFLIPSSKSAGAQLKFCVEFLETSVVSTGRRQRVTASIELVNGAKKVKFVYHVGGKVGEDKIDGSRMEIELGLGQCHSQDLWCNISLSTAPTLISIGQRVRLDSAEIKLELFILNEVPFVKVFPPDISSDLETSLGMNDSMKDVTIFAGPDCVEIKASKFMLCARSTYFDSMFRTEMKEKATNCVKLSFEPDICQEVISYIHTDETPNIMDPGMAEKLWYAAHMYELPGLQARCENALAMQITEENAAHLLAFTSLIEYAEPLEELKEYVLEFITKGNGICKKVMMSEGWSEIKSNLDIVHAVLEQLACDGKPPPCKKVTKDLNYYYIRLTKPTSI